MVKNADVGKVIAYPARHFSFVNCSPVVKLLANTVERDCQAQGDRDANEMVSKKGRRSI